jgi:hypothetical protein
MAFVSTIFCYRAVGGIIESKKMWQTMATCKINGLWGNDKFHGNVIPKRNFKVVVIVAHVVDVLGESTLWWSKNVVTNITF